MAVLIAFAVVAFLIWQAQQRQRRGTALPPAAEARPMERPFPDMPRDLVPSFPASAERSPSHAVPLSAQTAAPTPYAFASKVPRHGDRSAHIGRLARGKGLCSPRQPPS